MKIYLSTQVLSSSNSVRPGFYEITEIKSLTFPKGFMKLEAAAFWHPTNSGETVRYPVIVQASTLFNKHSVGPKELDPGYLTGFEIEVLTVEKVPSNFEGRHYDAGKVTWQISKFPPTMVKYQPETVSVPPTPSTKFQTQNLEIDDAYLADELAQMAWEQSQ